jgi:hypothetical protein
VEGGGVSGKRVPNCSDFTFWKGLAMLDIVFDFLLNVICFKVGAISIRLITWGRHSPTTITAKYPFAIAMLGLIELLALIAIIIFLMKG